jgi:hypothetical protein
MSTNAGTVSDSLTVRSPHGGFMRLGPCPSCWGGIVMKTRPPAGALSSSLPSGTAGRDPTGNGARISVIPVVPAVIIRPPIIGIPVGYSQCAVHPAKSSTDHTADNAANWASRAIPFVCTFVCAPRDLRFSRNGHDEYRECTNRDC